MNQILLVLGAFAFLLFFWRWLGGWVRFSLRSLVFFVLVIAASGALVQRDLSEEPALTEHGTAGDSVFSTDGSTLAIAGMSTMEIWDTKTLNHIQIPNVTRAPIAGFAFRPQGDVLVVGGSGGVRVFNVAAGSGRSVPEPAEGFGVFSPSGQMLATGSLKEICIWSWPGLAPVGTIDEGLGSLFREVVWSPDGSRLAVSGLKNEFNRNTTTRVWAVKDGRLLYTVEGKQPFYSPDGKLLATIREDWRETQPNSFELNNFKVLLWDASDGKPRDELEVGVGTNEVVRNATFSREGNLILTASVDEVCAWDPDGGRCRAKFRVKNILQKIVDLPGRQGLLCLSVFGPRLYRWDYRAPWAAHPFLGYVEFWLLVVLGLALLVSLIQDIRLFRRARMEAATKSA